MAEIHDLEHAEDQRQPDRDEKQQHADDEAAGGLRHQAGGTGETAGKCVEIQGKHPLQRAGTGDARKTFGSEAEAAYAASAVAIDQV